MKRFALAVVLLLVASIAGAERLCGPDDPAPGAAQFFSIGADSVSWVSGSSQSGCWNINYGNGVRTITCGVDNAGKVHVADCKTIGFEHAWVEEKVQSHQRLAIPDNTLDLLTGEFHSTFNLPCVRITRRCQNCSVVEEKYQDVTEKWRRK